MGWDYVTYGERYVHLHDMDLWTLRHFFADAAGALEAEQPSTALFAEAQAFFASWEWPGPGVVTGTELDIFVKDSAERKRALVQVCDRAVGRLREFGEVVPLAYLKAYVNAGSPCGVYVGDTPSAGLVEGAERIRSMLSGASAEPFAAPDPARVQSSGDS